MAAYKGLTAEQLKIVDQFRSRLESLNVEEFKLQSSNFVMRYLHASKFNLDKAEDNVHEYLMALKKYNAKEVIDAKFPSEFTDNFTTYIGGGDNEGRPSKFTWKSLEICFLPSYFCLLSWRTKNLD